MFDSSHVILGKKNVNFLLSVVFSFFSIIFFPYFLYL